MFEQLLISKKEMGKFKVTIKNPLGLTCEKITQTPRAFNTAQIKSAIENISFIDIEEKIFPLVLIRTTEFILKDFFLYMHQTGLYNRQFKLWRTLANITEITLFKLQKGIVKKGDLNVYMIDLFIDPKAPCISVIIDENIESKYKDFKIYLSKALLGSILKRLKGIFYFLNTEPEEEFIRQLELITNTSDPILKYESKLLTGRDIRLNVVSYRKDNEKYNFKHLCPELKSAR